MTARGSTEIATLGGGRFWCLEAIFLELRGVISCVSGYAGGRPAYPSYEEICGGRTGHAEVVQVTFDPAELAYADLLRVFFTIHDPTTLNRQGNDVGTQYRSIIFTNSAAQRALAEALVVELTAAGWWWYAKPVTQILPEASFYQAEPEHQDYYANNPQTSYCLAVVGPTVANFRSTFAARHKPRRTVLF